MHSERPRKTAVVPASGKAQTYEGGIIKLGKHFTEILQNQIKKVTIVKEK